MKFITFTISLILFSLFSYTQTSTLNRPNDPVVITGAQLNSFLSLAPNQIVGFKFVNGTWIQIPIQVDERALLDIVTPYGPLASSIGYPPSASNPKVTFYCDANTYTSADPTATFDADDELVFMSKDAGGQRDNSFPAGVINSSCQQVTISDPLGGSGYVYLFQNGGSLQQGAGVSYVTYSTNLPATSGFPANGNIINTENTSITTSKYSWHFSAEWVSDVFKIIASNVDILDRHKNFFANGNCLRHENSFSAAENAYATTKAGPVRVIRSYMGANSGPLTQRTHIFYENRQDIITDLRVHNITSIYDVFDYNSAANGMTYRNNLNTNGVIINGQQDAIRLGDLQWEQVSGTQGTVSHIHRRATSLAATEATFTSYYDDNTIKPASNCTGDGQAWGTSGVGIVFGNGSVCTDPMGNACAGSQWLRNLQSRRTVYTDAPNAPPTTASDYNNKLNNPLTISIAGVQSTTNYTVVTNSNPVNGGSTTGGGTYAPGSSVTVTATANNGFVFTSWTENGNIVSRNATYTFNIFSNRNLVSNFSQNTNTYTVAASANPAAGGSTSGGGTYVAGASVTITATANNGYTFIGWTENGNRVSSNASYTFIISANRNFVANFIQDPNRYPVTLSVNAKNGGMTAGQGSDSINTILVFPIPSRGIVHIISKKQVQLRLFNAVGQLVLSTRLAALDNQIEINKTGIYLLQLINSAGQKIERRLVIER